jgi:NADPH:quinone reductase-like Zn-dependent oxidoreductase
MQPVVDTIAVGRAEMRALYQEVYGKPEEVLTVREVEQPVVPDDGVLVRVAAASIHVGDCFVVQGLPKAMRPIFGLRRPKSAIPGTDIAGTVEAVGSAVKGWQPGDEVFGNCTGAFAEYAATSASELVAKPAGLDFEGTSALGVSAQTALQAVRDHLGVESGQKVLITGASGGVGSFAVQIAKSLGAEVTAVCSAGNAELVASFGADHVIDYASQDFTTGTERYDRILDNVGAYSMSATRKALTPDGLLLSNGAPVGGWFGGLGNPLRGMLWSMVNKQQARPFISTYSQADGQALKELVEDGKVKPAIGHRFPLEEGPAAVAHVASRHAQGKTIITMGEPGG